MAIILNKEISEDTTIGVWKIEENLEQLLGCLFKFGVNENSHDIINLKNFSNERRKSEWIATRVLVNEILNENTHITYDTLGKPHLYNRELNISISHSHGMVAVLLSKKKEVGIDIELLSDKIARIALKFLNIEESKGIEEKNKIRHLYLHWCAKEALYKIYGKKELSFAKNIHILPFNVNDNGTFKGVINTPEIKQEYILNYQHIDNYVMVWSVR